MNDKLSLRSGEAGTHNHRRTKRREMIAPAFAKWQPVSMDPGSRAGTTKSA
jgi:hypothetical protein